LSEVKPLKQVFLCSSTLPQLFLNYTYLSSLRAYWRLTLDTSMHVASALTKPFRICVSKGKECESECVHLCGRWNGEEREVGERGRGEIEMK
jgi:hypothetical protein